MTNNNKKTMDFVLSGGGPKGDGHAGFLKALEEEHINIGTGTGVSIGSVVLALYKNGYSPEKIHEIICLQFEQLKDHSESNKSCLRWPSPLEFVKGELLDMLPVFRKLVAEYNLKPQHGMQIIAYDIINKKPKVFSGTSYNLAEALTASCALPFLMRPVAHCDKENVGSWKQLWQTCRHLKNSKDHDGHGIYFDGWMHHPFAFDFSNKPVLISRLGAAGTITRKRWSQLSFPDKAFHLLELLQSKLGQTSFAMPDPKEGLVIDSGLSSVASVAWDLPREVHKEMFDHAYAATKRSLKEARKTRFITDEFCCT